MLENFHFIRPWILPGIPLTGLIWWAARRAADPARPWLKSLDKDLLDAFLLRSGKNSHWRAHDFLLLLGILLTLAAAGPTWRIEPSPFQEETTTVVIVLECSPSMDQTDLQPSRLERAKLKIADFLAARPGARHGLIAYAGSAHLVMPPTADSEVINSMTSELSSDIMPKPGEDLAAALALARRTLDGQAGGILLLADDPAAPPAAPEEPLPDLVWLAAIPPGAVPGSLSTAARNLGADLIPMTVDESDTAEAARRLSRIRSTASAAQIGAYSPRWQESGYWLCPLILLVFLPWFRRGWLIRWTLLTAALLPLTTPTAHAGGSTAFTRLFFTPDQQAHRLLEAGKPAEAAATFTDPLWRGVAWYRAREFKRAAQAFASIDSPITHYNRGNCLIFLGNYQDAITAYDAALATRPDWQEAKDNRAIAIARAKALDFEGGNMTGGQLGADEIVFDGKKNNDSSSEEQTETVQGEGMSSKEIEALWLRRVQTKPRDFLRVKFAYQAQSP